MGDQTRGVVEVARGVVCVCGRRWGRWRDTRRCLGTLSPPPPIIHTTLPPTYTPNHTGEAMP